MMVEAKGERGESRGGVIGTSFSLRHCGWILETEEPILSCGC